MLNFFKRPYNESGSGSAKEKFLMVFGFGFFIFLFLYLFKPFGITDLPPVPQLLVTSGFGLVTMFILFVFKFLFEPAVIRGTRTIGKSLLWVILITLSIGIANFLYATLIFKYVFAFRYFLYIVWTTILVAFIPVTVTYLIHFNRIYRNALENAAVPTHDVFRLSQVIITAGNPKNEIKADPKNIVYLSSNDNYVTIVSRQADRQVKTTIRGTLKYAEQELKKDSRFIRCHKCYIVNLDFTERVTGHNQNMKIWLLSSAIEIPVSRSKAEKVNKMLKKIANSSHS